MSNAHPADSLPSSQPEPRPSATERISDADELAARPLSELFQRDPFSRPSAPLLDFGVPRESATRMTSVENTLASSGRQHSLEELHDPNDPLLVPSVLQSTSALLEDADLEPLEDCPPTVRTPRFLDRALADLAEHQSEDAAEQRDEALVSVVEAEDDDGPDSLRVGGAEADFFRFESFPPVVEDIDAPASEPAGPPPPSPEQLARTARLRKGVGAVVALAAVLALVAVIIGAVGPRERGARVVAQGVRHAPAEPVGATVAAAETRPSADGASSDLGLADHASAGATEALAAAESTDGGDTAKLRARAVAALTAQKLELAAQLSRQLIATEPDHAFGYRCLGAAQQDQGEWAVALETYGACVRHAVRGDVGECAALGGR